MKYLSKNIIKNKKVLLRCDFNVPVKDGKIIDTSKIDNSLKTIKYLLDNDNIVIVLSHFGRLNKEEDKKDNSLYVVYAHLKEKLDIEFIKDNLHLENVLNNSKCHLFLVENTRFTDISKKRESINDLELAKYWASFADVFVIDAFASLHRVHSSSAGISKFLPTYAGFLVEEELKKLDILIKNTPHPFTVIMGGAKVDDKIKIIKNIIKRCDRLILTGGILNTFLMVEGYNIGNSLVSKDYFVLEEVKDLLKNYKDKIEYSLEFITNKGLKNINEIEKDDTIFDNLLSDIDFPSDKIVFVNGTCGKYEDIDYERGTKELLKKLSNIKATVIVGGGDAVSAVKYFNLENSFNYLSSGGGATLEYVSTGRLQVIDYIENKQK